MPSRLQKFMYNHQQEKQGANYYYSCAQRTCGNASAPQKIIQATTEAGDVRHVERTALPNVPPNIPERFLHTRRAVHHTASACRTSICCINLPAQTSRCGRVAWLSKSRRAPFHLVVMDNGCLRWTKNLEIECHYVITRFGTEVQETSAPNTVFSCRAGVLT